LHFGNAESDRAANCLHSGETIFGFDITVVFIVLDRHLFFY